MDKLEPGLATPAGTAGGALSSGQRHRIALTRLLVRGPSTPIPDHALVQRLLEYLANLLGLLFFLLARVKFLANLVTADATAMSGLSGTILGTPLSVTVDLVSGIALAHMIARKLASVLVALAPVLVAFIGAGKSTIMPHLSLL